MYCKIEYDCGLVSIQPLGMVHENCYLIGRCTYVREMSGAFMSYQLSGKLRAGAVLFQVVRAVIVRAIIEQARPGQWAGVILRQFSRSRL